MKNYVEPEVKLLAYLQMEKNCFEVSDELQEEAGDGDDFGKLQ